MSKNVNMNGLMNAQDALVAIMVAGGASDENISNRELVSISRICLLYTSPSPRD